ncbi:fermentation/respiration switch protein [Izhakiella australiensis]|uniref:Esterase FrsA n=1 Tax=Izhakiella australiensis TaxID=1926881 RepID=A0A1S8YCF0_9GAMM|nr:esterase FrsA [Izhakiella australiensis]OON36438.1 fermentation/respiration switch protein [Izhakiella australiensis]
MTSKNLSEELFKPRFKHPETSSLIRRQSHPHPGAIHTALDGENQHSWYRMINRLLWIWRGISPIELSEVLARIATSQEERTREHQLDTVIGYRNGNWIYEWSQQAAQWQDKAQLLDNNQAGDCWMRAATLFSLAGYPYLKGDQLADQAQVLANRAYEQAARFLPGELKELSFNIPGGTAVNGFLHMPAGVSAPYPTVLICGALDALQSDHYRLFHDYLAPLGLAMLTIDVPSVGFSARWKLTEDASFLHQQVLRQLTDIPWIDHTRVAAFGYRFGASIAVRLAYLEAPRLKGVACMGPIVHSLLSDPGQQDAIPDMYADLLASRLGMTYASDEALRRELNCYSLKVQGLLGRRCATPMLSCFWPGDPFSPESESRLISQSSAQGTLLSIPASPVMRSFQHALQQISEWIAKRVGA